MRHTHPRRPLVLALRVTEVEKSAVEAVAEANGLPVSTLLRSIVLPWVARGATAGAELKPRTSTKQETVETPAA